LFGNDDRRVSFSFSGNPSEMFGTLSAIIGAASTETTFAHPPTTLQVLEENMLADFAASPPHEQEVPDFDDARDNSSPINMHETSSYGALLNSADPMLKTSQSDLITDDSNLIKPASLTVEIDNTWHETALSSPVIVAIPSTTTPTTMAENENTAAAAFVHDRKRHFETTIAADDLYDAQQWSDRSGTTSPTDFGTAGETPRTKRPRRAPPTSLAVREAMPKPPPRGRPNPEREEALRGLLPEGARLEKNRRSAKECRLRKKEYVTNLEAKVAEFEERELARNAELAAVHAHLAALQREVAAFNGDSAASQPTF
jgi:hypothetical protein